MGQGVEFGFADIQAVNGRLSSLEDTDILSRPRLLLRSRDFFAFKFRVGRFGAVRYIFVSPPSAFAANGEVA